MAQILEARSVPTDAAGRSLGISVFLVGVLLLIAVFVIAYLNLIAADDGSFFERMINLPITLIFKGGVLLIMGIVASAIANKGIALYEAARARERE